MSDATPTARAVPVTAAHGRDQRVENSHGDLEAVQPSQVHRSHPLPRRTHQLVQRQLRPDRPVGPGGGHPGDVDDTVAGHPEVSGQLGRVIRAGGHRTASIHDHHAETVPNGPR